MYADGSNAGVVIFICLILTSAGVPFIFFCTEINEYYYVKSLPVKVCKGEFSDDSITYHGFNGMEETGNIEVKTIIMDGSNTKITLNYPTLYQTYFLRVRDGKIDKWLNTHKKLIQFKCSVDIDYEKDPRGTSDPYYGIVGIFFGMIATGLCIILTIVYGCYKYINR